MPAPRPILDPTHPDYDFWAAHDYLGGIGEWAPGSPSPPPPRRPRMVTDGVDRLNRKQARSVVEEVQQTTSKLGDPYPIVYGYASVGPSVVAVAVHPDGDLVLVLGWCIGPVDAIVHVTESDATPNARVSFTHYRGDPADANYGQVDPWAAAAITGYADTMVASHGSATVPLCYTVAKVPRGTTQGFPQFKAFIRGRRVYDPRDGGQDVADASTWLWSDNAALCTADFYASAVYGAGRALDWTSVGTAATANDQLVGGERSFQVNLALVEPTEPDGWIEVLRTYGNLILQAREGGAIMRAVVDEAPGRVITDMAPANTIGAIRITQRPIHQDPTVVRVGYTHIPADEPYVWRTETVSAERGGVHTGDVPWRRAAIDMPGITDRTIALRFATSRASSYAAEMQFEWIGGDDAWRDEIGDVVDVAAARAPATKRARIVQQTQIGPGRYRIVALEDGPQLYSDEVADDIPDDPGGIGNPLDIPAVAGVTAAEEVYLAADGRWRNRIRVRWDDPGYAYPHTYRVQVLCDGKLLWTISVGQADERTAATGTVAEAKRYECQVQVVTAISTGDWGMTTITTVGKLLVPGPPPGLTSYAVNGELRLRWQAGADSDVVRYRIDYKQITGGDPDPIATGALVLDETDALSYTTKEIPEGYWRIWCYAIDSVKQLSDPPAATDVTITQANDAYIVTQADIALDEAASANIEQRYRDRNETDWSTYVDDGTDADDLFTGSDVGTDYPSVMAAYGTSAAALDDPDFANGLTSYTSSGATTDSGGDGNRIKLTGSGAAAYIYTTTSHATPVGATFVVGVLIAEESGDPQTEIIVEEGIVIVTVSGRTWRVDNGDGTATLYGIHTPAGSTSFVRIGVRVPATDGSYAVIDELAWQRWHDWQSQVLDVGADVSGTFHAQMQWRELAGGPAAELWTLPEGGSDWVRHNGQLAVRTTARYAQVRIQGEDEDRWDVDAWAGRMSVIAVTQRRTGTLQTEIDTAWDYQADGGHFAASATPFSVTGDLTLLARVRPDVVGNGTGRSICGKDYISGVGALYLGIGSTDVAPLIWRGGPGSGTNYDEVRTGNILTAGETYAVAMRRDTGDQTLSLWVDGVLEAGPSLYAYSPGADSATEFGIGDGYVAAFNGRIFEVLVYSRKITDAEIEAWTYAGAVPSSPLGHYKFGESGMTLTDNGSSGTSLVASGGLGSTDDHVTEGVPAWVVLDEKFSGIKSFSFTPLYTDTPASIGVPKIQLLAEKTCFGVIAYLDGAHVEQTVTYQMEAV